jgi:hypothetical protein
MWEFAKDWAQIAPDFTLLVALSAFLIAWRQLVLNRQNQRETTAKSTFREYLRLAVQYPELAQGNDGTLKGNELERYKWLVGYLLWSTEELLELKQTEDVWTDNLKMLLGYHYDYLSSEEFTGQELKTYSTKTRALIQQVIIRKAINPPAA